MGAKGSHEHDQGQEAASAAAASPQNPSAVHGATAAGAAGQRPARRRDLAAGLVGAAAVTLVSLVFIITFIGGLHTPGPRSVPVGLVGSPAQATALGNALDHKTPGGFSVTAYPTAAAARSAVLDRTIDAAVTPGPRVPVLLVATAVSPALARATIQDIRAVALSVHTVVTVQNIRPLPSNDPDGLSPVYFVIALMTPSLLFGNVLVSRISPRLNPLLQLAVIAVYAVIAGSVATALADPAIGALTGAPWGIFGIGTLLAFAAATIAAAARRWTGGVGYIALALLLIPVGISSSGTTLGPNMITPWYADLGKALPAGSAMPAVQNTVYFNGSDITTPLLILSAWALAGVLAMIMAALLHPPIPGQAAQRPGQDPSLATS